MELQNIFNSWASGHTAKKFTHKQWMLSKWENVEGIDWPQEKITAMVGQIRARLDFKENHSFLDLGCGGGWLLKEVASGKAKGYGVDLSFQMLKHAADFYPDGCWINGQAAELPFKDASFDRVLCYFVFINIQDTDYIIKALFEINRVLKPGGKALIGQLPDRKKSADYDQAKKEYMEYCKQNFELGENHRDEDYVPLQLFDPIKFCSLAGSVGMICRLEPSFNPFFHSEAALTVDWRFDAILEKPDV